MVRLRTSSSLEVCCLVWHAGIGHTSLPRATPQRRVLLGLASPDERLDDEEADDVENCPPDGADNACEEEVVDEAVLNGYKRLAQYGGRPGEEEPQGVLGCVLLVYVSPTPPRQCSRPCVRS